jgi:hypothetical protein
MSTVQAPRYAAAKMPPAAKWQLGAVAIDDTGTVLGVVTQRTRVGLPVYSEGFHTLELVVYLPKPSNSTLRTIWLDIHQVDCVDNVCGAIIVLCLFFGRPYGFCKSEWGLVLD